VLSTDVRLYPCVSPRAWAMLSAIGCSRREPTSVIDALEWSLEIGRQVFHSHAAGVSPSPLLEPYAHDYGHSVRVEHAALAQSRPWQLLYLADLPPDLRDKLSYLARRSNRTVPDVVEWCAELAIRVMGEPAARRLLNV
jgi:hypothetical protein